jgi:hypothetical protein
MSDKYKIYIGLIIFIAIVTFPFWYNLGRAAPVPELAKAKGEMCVLPAEEMKTEHMKLLDVWRDTVVREGNRIYVNSSGKEFEMSLTNTCLDCHAEKAEFCDKCHNYASVSPYCWDCHVDPKEKL